MGWDDEYLGYTNNDNPFGDQHLLEKFQWHKKKEKELKTLNLSEKELLLRDFKRQEENRVSF